MPSNPEKERHNARKFIDNILMNQLKELPEGIQLNELIRQTVVRFAVPPLTIKKFIEDYYLSLDYIKIEDNIILKGASL